MIFLVGWTQICTWMHLIHMHLHSLTTPASFSGTGNPALTSAGSHPNRSKLSYSAITAKPLYIGNDAYTMGDLHYTPMYSFVDNTPAESLST